jgi:hypothetical protein
MLQDDSSLRQGYQADGSLHGVAIIVATARSVLVAIIRGCEESHPAICAKREVAATDGQEALLC